MGSDWQISAGYLSELSRPAIYALSVLASTLILTSARKQFNHLATIGWTLGSFALPHIVAPLYLAALIIRSHKRRDDPARAEHATTVDETVSPTTSEPDEQACAPSTVDARSDETSAVETQLSTSDENEQMQAKPLRFGFSLPFVYASLLLAAGALLFFNDYRSADAHFARAKDAKLFGQTDRAISEYRSALARKDDAHTRKQLGSELYGAGKWEEALDQFLMAGRMDKQDDLLAYHIGLTLEAMGRRAEASTEYQKFLRSPQCTQQPMDSSCNAAQKRVEAIANEAR